MVLTGGERHGRVLDIEWSMVDGVLRGRWPWRSYLYGGRLPRGSWCLESWSVKWVGKSGSDSWGSGVKAIEIGVQIMNDQL
eukprot:4094373-Amphidinium_carterae.1